ncbi:conserved hypothetical protein [Cupriavidus taiwanensis]|uniref:Integrase catalytic domain-containing protein n=1 Tax=Cupriavidus taiwanensis TaxID=164546 RepID=A0A375B8T3_9BURK|nr:hypothetical protein [Cupriavidus taiwanensis]SOY40024.1 conserved hypothetical protein [Cupriavidus taiwanensis]
MNNMPGSMFASHAQLDVSEMLPVQPLLATPEEVRFLLDIQAAQWPAGLSRFQNFARARDPGKRYRAAAWNHLRKELRVLEMSSSLTTKGEGIWHTWSLVKEPDALDDVRALVFLEDIIDPSEFAKEDKELNRALLNAVLFVKRDMGDGKTQLLINDAVLMSEKNMQTAIQRVYKALGRARWYQDTLKLLIHRYFHYGGTDDAFLKMGHLRGGGGGTRENGAKPGPLNAREIESANRAQVDRRYSAKRQKRVSGQDKENMLTALRTWWVNGKSLTMTYFYMRKYFYPSATEYEIPKIERFYEHAAKLIGKYRLLEERDGYRLHAIHNGARVGQATDLTDGRIEIIDVDGFQAKIYVQHPDKDHKAPVVVWVIFAVSRLSSAVLGYSICLGRENARAYKEAIASVQIPKTGPGSKAEIFGISKPDGLLHGNYDEVYADNGPGRAKSVIEAVVDRASLRLSITPPGRPEMRAIGESLNCLMMDFLSGHPAGFTRRTNYFDKEAREKARKAKPIPLREFEQLLLEAINHINCFYPKLHKRTAKIRKTAGGVAPKDIFKYTQSIREGDGKRIPSSLEVWARFGEWKLRRCKRGVVEYASLEYSSDDLATYFEETAPVNGKDDVWAKVQPTGDPHQLLWLKDDGGVEFLAASGESSRKLDDGMTWLEWNLVTGHEKVKEEETKNAGGADRVRIDESMNAGAPEKPAPKRDRSRLTKKQHDGVATAAANRAPGVGINAGDSAEWENESPELSRSVPPQTKKPPRAKAKRKPSAGDTAAPIESAIFWNSDPEVAARLADF